MDNRPDIDEAVQRIFGMHQSEMRRAARTGEFFFTIGGLDALIHTGDLVMIRDAIDLVQNYRDQGIFSERHADSILKQIYVGIEDNYMKGQALDAMSPRALTHLSIEDIIEHTPEGSFLEGRIVEHAGWGVTKECIGYFREGVGRLLTSPEAIEGDGQFLVADVLPLHRDLVLDAPVTLARAAI